MYEFLGWLEVNKKRVAIWGGSALVAIGIIVTVVWFKSQQEFQASEALSAIRLPYNPAETVPAEVMSQLQKLIADHAGTAAALRAELIRAGLLFVNGQYPDAQAAFEKFIRDHPESRWLSEAVYGVAVSLDAQGKTAEATAKYEDFARRFATDPNIDQVRVNLATLYEAANKPAEALKEYEKVTKSMSYSPAFGEAQERQRLLLAKHPNLAPTNPPTLTPTMPPVPRTGVVSTVRTNLAPRTTVPLVLRTNLLPPKTVPPPGTSAPVRPK